MNPPGVDRVASSSYWWKKVANLPEIESPNNQCLESLSMTLDKFVFLGFASLMLERHLPLHGDLSRQKHFDKHHHQKKRTPR